MKLKLPAPREGWRAFSGEVGIIVLGVLLALAAQQIVETIQTRQNLAGFRAALRDELRINLGTYPHRSAQKKCIDARLNELQRWLDGWRAGRPLIIRGPIGIPVSRVIGTSVWGSRDPATIATMPLKEKLDYSFLYNEFANNEVHRLDEREAWIELASFENAPRLEHADMIRLQGLIFRARLRDRRIDENAERFMRYAADIGLTPKAGRNAPPLEPELCRPILSPGRPA